MSAYSVAMRLSPLRLRALVREIVFTLDGRVWTPDTLEAIASVLRSAGFEIREPNEEV